MRSPAIGALGVLAVCVLAAPVSAVFAQSPAPQAAFDVVSIKPNNSATPGRTDFSPGGRIQWTNTTLKALMGLAYMRFPFDFRDMVGGPSWINADGFAVIATTNRALRTTPDGYPVDLIAMLRTLVEDRFQVRVHNESHEAPVYALVVARSDKKLGSGLRAAPDACAEAMADITAGKAPQPQRPGPPACSFFAPPGRIFASGVTLTMLSNVLSGKVGRAVIDQTGLSGSFDIELSWTPDQLPQGPPPAGAPAVVIDPNGPSIFTAIQEQLGLKLEPTKGPVDVLVIDRAERPTPD